MARKTQLRLPYIKLPFAVKAFNLSVRSRRESGIRWGHQLRKAVRQSHGANCYYCGAPPGIRQHDCHEVFKVNYSTHIITLMDIVPACSICHRWADGEVGFIEWLFWTKARAATYIRQRGIRPPGMDENVRDGVIEYYELGVHFRRVNQLTIRAFRTYLRQARRYRQQRANPRIQWQVDYGEWCEYAGLAKGQLYQAVSRRVSRRR